jgi:hypothetical protein
MKRGRPDARDSRQSLLRGAGRNKDSAKHRIVVITALLAAGGAAPGCAEILGLEPPGGGAGGGAGTGAAGPGGTGGAPASCDVDADCSAPICQVPECLNGKCSSKALPDGASVPCYSGSPETLGMGPCKAGEQLCTGGLPEGRCNGELTPAAEDCSLAGDENCDGKDDACVGDVIDVLLFQGGTANDLRGVVVGPAGEVYVTGTYTMAGFFETCALPDPSPGVGAFLAKLTPDFTCQWVTTLATPGTKTSLSHPTLHEGGIWAVGSAETTVEVSPEKQVLTLEGRDAVVLGVDPDGKLIELFKIGGAASDYGVSLAAGQTLHALVEGLSGTINSAVGGGTWAYSAIHGGYDAILVDLTDKNVLGTRSIGSGADDTPRAVAVADGRILIGGGLGDAASPPVGCPAGMTGKTYGFVLDQPEAGAGDPSFCASWAGESHSYTTSLFAAPGGKFALAGYGPGLISDGCFDAGVMAVTNAFVRLGTAAAPCQAAKVLNSTVASLAGAVRLDGSTVLLAGSFQGTVEAPSVGDGKDIFVHRYSAGLNGLLWHTELGSLGDDELGALTVSPVDGTILVVGACRGDAFTAAGNCDIDSDGYLVRLAP